MNGFTFLGAPADSVLRGGGAERSPDRLRELDLPSRLRGADAGDLPVRVRGDVRDPETGIIASDEVIANTVTIRVAVRDRIVAGERVFLAGGCCANAPGAVAGARDVLGRVGLVYVDGHQDLWDGSSSSTGEAADMPLGVAIGVGPTTWVDANDGPAVQPGDTVLLANRDHEETVDLPDPGADLGIAYLPIERVRELGPETAGASARSVFDDTLDRFWLHLDVDVLDMHVFPATDYLDPGGLSWDELGELLTPLGASPRLCGVSLGCFNPEKDPSGSCGRTLADLLEAVLAS